MIESYVNIKNVTKTIKGVNVLENITLDFDKGKIYGFQGKNGSGKTMLLRAICGLILCSKGEIVINGEIIGKDISFPRNIGALIEYPGFIPQYTGLKNLMLLASIQKRVTVDDIYEAISIVGLDPKDKRKFKKYSLGMKQRLGLAQAIMEDPDIIVLDEPTNALDEKGILMVRNLLLNLKERGKTIFIASHDKEELDFIADEKFMIENGKIISHNKPKQTV
ncbi:ATP-binding cassette domain-containing protein [Neobacillus sp. PS2-9]|uniref:ATP-binding cassette domain-containing protein n=1 Tax=Neobacillus sp. PS2-9 TaxID=3070676 RepID=UPI0027E14A45|nr:ATP-binding cassette domain-containing protein [Neobacillus sp. PS2-9]WML58720.1 ATP-binding cassette domain-containing protein [Neobacillus sp. PS2-9]